MIKYVEAAYAAVAFFFASLNDACIGKQREEKK